MVRRSYRIAANEQTKLKNSRCLKEKLFAPHIIDRSVPTNFPCKPSVIYIVRNVYRDVVVQEETIDLSKRNIRPNYIVCDSVPDRIVKSLEETPALKSDRSLEETQTTDSVWLRKNRGNEKGRRQRNRQMLALVRLSIKFEEKYPGYTSEDLELAGYEMDRSQLNIEYDYKDSEEILSDEDWLQE